VRVLLDLLGDDPVSHIGWNPHPRYAKHPERHPDIREKVRTDVCVLIAELCETFGGYKTGRELAHLEAHGEVLLNDEWVEWVAVPIAG
jgi:hypothetical protein